MTRLLTWVFPPTPRRQPSSPPRCCRPLLELLEARELLSSDVSITLTGLPSGEYINSFAGVGFQENMVGSLYATVNGQADPNKNDFNVQIQWGDGKTSTADLVHVVGGQFLFKGSHTYQQLATLLPITATATGQGSAAGGSAPETLLTDANVSAMPSGFPGTPPDTGGPTPPAKDVSLGLKGLPSGQYVNTAVGDTSPYTVGFLQAQVNNEPDNSTGDYHAYVNWGDSSDWHIGRITLDQSQDNTVVSNFIITASPPPYKEAQTGVPLVIYVTGPDGTSASGWVTTANVSPPVPAPVLKGNVSNTDGIEGNDVPLGTFNDNNPPTGLKIEINWNDPKANKPLQGTIEQTGPGTYQIKGTVPTNINPGPHKITVTLSNNQGGKSTTQDNVNVLPQPQTAGVTLNLIEGRSSGTVTVATFKPLPGDATPTGATIDWGDDLPETQGHLVSDGHGGFKVTGTHTYREDGPYTILVTFKDPNGPVPPVLSKANVADGALEGTGFDLTNVAGVSENNVELGFFRDAGTPEAATSYQATIYWQGTPPSGLAAAGLAASGLAGPTPLTSTGTVVKVAQDEYEILGTPPSLAQHNYSGYIAVNDDSAHTTIPFKDTIKTLTLQASGATQTTIDLSWSSVPAKTYKLYAYESSNSPQEIGAAAWGKPIYVGTQTSFKATGLTPDRTYSFRLVADLTNGKTASAMAQGQTECNPTTETQGVTAQQLQNLLGVPDLQKYLGLTSTQLQNYLSAMNAAMTRFHITTPARQAAFLAEVAEESNFKNWSEKSPSSSLGDYYGRGPIQLTGTPKVNPKTHQAYVDPGNYQQAATALKYDGSKNKDGTVNINIVTDPNLVSDYVNHPEVGWNTSAWYFGARATGYFPEMKNGQIVRYTTGKLKGQPIPDLHNPITLNNLADKFNFLKISQIVNGSGSHTPNGWPARMKEYKKALEVIYFGRQGNEVLKQIGDVAIPNVDGIVPGKNGYTAKQIAAIRAGLAATLTAVEKYSAGNQQVTVQVVQTDLTFVKGKLVNTPHAFTREVVVGC